MTNDYEVVQSLLENYRDDEHYDRSDYDRFLAKHPLSKSAPLVHITGTNGVADTGAFLANIYIAKGYHVGRYSSKEATSYRKMIQLDGKSLSKDAFCGIFYEFQKEFEAYHLTDLEAVTYMAYRFFATQKLDLLIMESNVGGQEDATRISGMPSTLAIITNVSLNQTYLLGKTDTQIAKDFAAIISEKGAVIVGGMDEEPRNVIRDHAAKMEASFAIVDDFHGAHYVAPSFRFDYRPFQNLSILSSASYLLPYAALAVDACNRLQNLLPVDEYSLRKGLEMPPLPCRYEKFDNIILDSSDNPEAVMALAKSVRSQTIGRKVHVLFAADRDANIARILPILDNVTNDITLTTYPDERARSEMDYFLFIGDHPYADDALIAVQTMLSTYPEDLILVTGNIRFAYWIREHIKEGLKF